MNKICSKCEIEKGLSRFSKDRSRKNGLRIWCKECCRESLRKYRKSNPEKRKVSKDKWNLENKEKATEIQKKASKKFCLENPEKRKAHQMVGNAITVGRLTRPSICESCFNERFTEGHHEDYSKPLDVEWLCKKCHIELHRKVLV